MITRFDRFINEQVEDRRVFNLSQNLVKDLTKMMDEYKVAMLLISLKEGVDRKYLVTDPVDFLDVDTEGNISFLKSRYFEEFKGNEFSSQRRQKSKASKILRDIYNESYINSQIKQTDIEAFVNKWSILHRKEDNKPHIEDLRGEDVLRAYGVTGELSSNFGLSCANWYKGRNTNIYDVYVKNPDNCGVVVVVDKGKIMGRRTYQQGIQVENRGYYKKGQYYTVYGNHYGCGGVYDVMIRDYLREEYNANGMHTKDGSFIIKFETRFLTYPPFDGMEVCFEDNLLSDGGGGNHKWTRAYGASCPTKLVKKRIEEEKHLNEPKPEPDLNFERDPYYFTRGLSMG